MRVLHLVTVFPRTSDDILAPWLVEMLKRLRAQGCEVEVFTSSYKGARHHTIADIPVWRFRYFFRRWENLTHEETAPDRVKRSLLYRIMPLFYVALGMWAVWRHCRRRRYDIAHVHWPLPVALFGWVARLACGARVVTTFYGIELRWVKGSMPLLKRFLAWAARTSDQVVAISSYTANEVRQIAAVDVEVIPYTAELRSPVQAVSRVSRIGFTILFVGNLIERKGVKYLIEALGYLPSDLNARLLVIGEGPERAALESLARAIGVAERVKFRGKVPEQDLHRAYAEADAFVLPAVVDSRGDTEGLGVVLLEAMSYKVPVVASRLGGITDIVLDGRTGVLVEPNDARSIAAALRRLASDPGYSASLGEAGFRRLHETFSWDSIVKRWLAIYDRVLAS